MTLLNTKLNEALHRISNLEKWEKHAMAVLDNLTAEVARMQTVDAAVMKKLDDLVAQIAALAQQTTVDPAALQALVDQIKANDDAMAAKTA